jgi:hypothetical protein
MLLIVAEKEEAPARRSAIVEENAQPAAPEEVLA